MSGFNYLDLYFDFQDLFKSVKDYDSLEDIIKDAMEHLVTVLHRQKENEDRVAKEAFVDAIKLVYFNYFSPVEGKEKEFEPINGRYIYLYDSTPAKKQELLERVSQHMSYYMGPKSSAKKFIRISRALIENESPNNVRDFFVRNNDGTFDLIVHDGQKVLKSVIQPLAEYPICIDPQLKRGDLTPFPEGSSSTYIFTPNDEEMNELEHDSEASKDLKPEKFSEVFSNPLAAHLVLLQDCSLLYVYSQTARVGSEGSIGYGGVFVLIDEHKDEDIVNDYIRFFRMISDSVSSCVAHNIMSGRLKNEADKSAKAAIMSRNMSHNLGSHVMAYLKQKLGSVANIIQQDSLTNNVLDDLYPAVLTHTLNSFDRTDYEKTLQMPFLVGLGKFIGYLQERQDYIATIATDYIPYGAPVNFKDAIYDELNPDLRYIRHHDDDNNNRPYNILLNYIAKSEGLSRENMVVDKKNLISTRHDIRFAFVSYSDAGEPSVFGLSCDRMGSDDPSLQVMRGYNFSLPGGLVGRQAVFSIIENIVRNAAKHGVLSKEDNLDLTFDFIDGADIKVGKFDNSPRFCSTEWLSLYKRADDIKDLWLLTITDNLKCDTKVVETIRNGLKSLYLEDGTKVATDYKGIKEIRISASWLRREKDETVYLSPDISNPKAHLAPLVGVELVKDNDSAPVGHLRYIIAFKKNKGIAVVLGKDTSSSLKTFFQDVQSIVPDCSVFGSPDHFMAESGSYDYSFIIALDQSTFNQLRPIVSNRIRKWDDWTYKAKGVDPEVFIKAFEEHLFKLFFSIEDRNDNKQPNDLLFIWDEKAALNEVLDSRVRTSKADEDSSEARFVYRKHHSAPSDFFDYWKKLKTENKYTAILSVEGITGDNSSDRLVRREHLDTRWYYEHLYALNSKVAIFDERLFKITHGIDETKVLSPSIAEIVKIRAQIQDGLMTNEVLEKFKRQCYHSEHPFKKLFTNAELEEFLHATTPKDLCDALDKLNPSLSLGKHMTPYNHLRGVDIFTVIAGDANTLNIVGCIGSEWDSIYHYRNQFGTIATISKTKNKDISIVFNEDESIKKEFMKKYDFISIHQGILDKIYERLGIKDIDASKLRVTEKLFDEFMKCNDKVDGYLPRFVIHSGRAKPSSHDMPQKQPFVQFSAIENAIKDCKYSLVQLLDLSRYQSDL